MANKVFRILSLSDQVVERMYSDHIKSMFPEVDLILSCGDLPYYYLEFILDTLNAPMYYVHGNHDPEVEIGDHGEKKYPWGADNLHGKIIDHKGMILLGYEGSIRYSEGIHQYTQMEMWIQVLKNVPGLLWNRIRKGRYVDILVTHSPADGLGDEEDHAHTGFKAFRWVIERFKPRYHLHGHVHRYDRNQPSSLMYLETIILNVSSFQQFDFEIGGNHG